MFDESIGRGIHAKTVVLLCFKYILHETFCFHVTLRLSSSILNFSLLCYDMIAAPYVNPVQVHEHTYVIAPCSVHFRLK